MPARPGPDGYRCLRPKDWPAADRAAWAAATRKGDLLVDDGPAARLRPGSLDTRADDYGRWLGWHLQEGSLDAERSPAGRVTREAVTAYVAALQRLNAPQTVLGRIAGLATVVGWFAPRQDWRWLRRIQARLRGRLDDNRSRKRARLRRAHDLLDLGLRLMRQACADTTLTWHERARLYRDGLLIALLALRPLRLANLMQLEIGRELVRRQGRWWLEIPGATTKNGELLELPFPDDLVPALEAYLADWRIRVVLPACRGHGRALWLGQHGRPLSVEQAYAVIMRHTAEAFGQPVNPHLFRDAAATTVAIDRPDQVGITTRLLGHRSSATTDRYYNLARATEAARAWHEVLGRV